MEVKRRPGQGVLNILRFNWHFYVLTGAVLAFLILVKDLFPQTIQYLIIVGIVLSITVIMISLLVSFYIYDLSDLYQFKWLDEQVGERILNIHAGFDETSDIISQKYPQADVTICDFYDPVKHTEVSIKRARRAYPPDRKTVFVKTSELPFGDNSFDISLVILSAHEIRCDKERAQFFRELGRIVKPNGRIFVTEHLRDMHNFLAYTVGFFHFHSRKSWLRTFAQAGLTVTQEVKTTPFITTFILEGHGNAL